MSGKCLKSPLSGNPNDDPRSPKLSITDKALYLETLLADLHRRDAFSIVPLAALFGNVDGAIEFAEALRDLFAEDNSP